VVCINGLVSGYLSGVNYSSIMGDMKMNFEVFTRTTGRSASEPSVSIQKRGSLSLNGAAYRLLRSNRVIPKHPRIKTESDFFVELLYDRENQTIGLRYAPPNNPNSYVVRKLEKANTYIVSAKGFLKHYQIRPGRVKRYTAHMHGPDVLTFSIGGK
jgi:hypothetical protein